MLDLFCCRVRSLDIALCFMQRRRREAPFVPGTFMRWSREEKNVRKVGIIFCVWYDFVFFVFRRFEEIFDEGKIDLARIKNGWAPTTANFFLRGMENYSNLAQSLFSVHFFFFFWVWCKDNVLISRKSGKSSLCVPESTCCSLMLSSWKKSPKNEQQGECPSGGAIWKPFRYGCFQCKISCEQILFSLSMFHIGDMEPKLLAKFSPSVPLH